MEENQRRNLILNVKCYADINSTVRVQDADIKTIKKIASVPQYDIFPQNKSMWENGGIDSSTGAYIESTKTLRSYFVPIKSNQKYKCTADGSHQLILRLYTNDKTYRDKVITSFSSTDFIGSNTLAPFSTFIPLSTIYVITSANNLSP